MRISPPYSLLKLPFKSLPGLLQDLSRIVTSGEKRRIPLQDPIDPDKRWGLRPTRTNRSTCENGIFFFFFCRIADKGGGGGGGGQQ